MEWGISSDYLDLKVKEQLRFVSIQKQGPKPKYSARLVNAVILFGNTWRMSKVKAYI